MADGGQDTGARWGTSMKAPRIIQAIRDDNTGTYIHTAKLLPRWFEQSIVMRLSGRDMGVFRFVSDVESCRAVFCVPWDQNIKKGEQFLVLHESTIDGISAVFGLRIRRQQRIAMGY